MTRRALLALAAALVLPASAVAHGIGGRSDLPIPRWLFAWAAAVVLVISFVALATPMLEMHLRLSKEAEAASEP